MAYKNFWWHTGREHDGSDRLSTRYLDINPEGAFLRETQDIAEELSIMSGIYRQQLDVVKDFKRYLGQLSRHTEFMDDIIEQVQNRKTEIEGLINAAERTVKQVSWQSNL